MSLYNHIRYQFFKIKRGNLERPYEDHWWYSLDGDRYFEMEEYLPVHAMSEPYPLVYSHQHDIHRNGGTYVGSSSETCVCVGVSGDEYRMYFDIPVKFLTPIGQSEHEGLEEVYYKSKQQQKEDNHE